MIPPGQEASILQTVYDAVLAYGRADIASDVDCAKCGRGHTVGHVGYCERLAEFDKAEQVLRQLARKLAGGQS